MTITEAVDVFWVLICAGLVFVMQAGFLCLESGLTRSKNSINVAAKNVSDFAIASLMFWTVGFGLMFGESQEGWVGTSLFGLLDQLGTNPVLTAFVLFQIMFCATSTTIVSGAVAERMRFSAYLGICILVSTAVYPVFGHWAWGSVWTGTGGWLEKLGFVDFAGATVVHSVGGWVAVVAVCMVGPRSGRFIPGREPAAIPAGNLPMAMLGALLLFFGWLGFNGGSALHLDATVPGILLNTTLAAVSGCVTGMLLGRIRHGHYDTFYLINGLLSGLVAVTGGVHAVTGVQAILIGMVGASVMAWGNTKLLKWRVDDAVGAIPVHLVAGIWGTLAVGIFGDLAILDTGNTRLQQIGVQMLGFVACAAWCVGVTWLFLRPWRRNGRLRVSEDDERLGLNVAEHGARTELIELLDAMERQRISGDLSQRVPEEEFTEVGQVATAYNRVICALEAVTQRTFSIVRDMRDGIVTFTHDGVLTSMNPGAETLLRTIAEAAMGRPFVQVLREAGCSDSLASEMVCRPIEKLELHMMSAGQKSFYELSVIENEQETNMRYMASVRDITDRKLVETQLHRERDLAFVTLASIADGVIRTDEAGIIQYINPVAARLTGWQAHHAKGQPIYAVYNLRDESTGKPLPNPVREVLSRGEHLPRREHALLVRRDEETVPVLDTAGPVRSRDGFLIGAVLVFHDVTVTLHLARELNHQATHDALTGIPNRREFERQLAALLAEAREGQNHVLCYLDLDQFKVVNDTCGHIAGDELLRQVTHLMRGMLRASDTVARLGGDEFGLLLKDCPIERAVQIANNLREAIAEFRFGWEGKPFSIGVSIGLVSIDAQQTDLGLLLARADAACYAAKESGRNRVHVYQADDIGLLEQQGQMQWVARLQSALDQDRLRLYVQPIVPLHAKMDQRRHFEILIRLEEEDGKLILPGAFLPAAERYGLMPRIDQWVVANTLAWMGDRLRQDGELDGMYCINLSGASLSDERFRDSLSACLKQVRLPAGILCFEITETAAVANLSKVVSFIGEVKQQGCLLALDDFGSGLSSFAYLKNLPVDFLKIDGGFIKDIETDPIDLAMVEAINVIGHVMGLKTIAEYVSSEVIRDRVRDLGIDYGQGYFLGEPQPLETLGRTRRMPR